MNRAVLDIDEAREAAAYWLARRQLGLMTSRDQAAFENWLGEAANAAAYDEAEASIASFGAVAASPEVRRMRDAALAAPLQARRITIFWRTAAAAAIVLLGVGTWSIAPRPSERTVPALDATIQGAAPAAPAPSARRYATAVGERSKYTLEDGSIVSLNTNTVLEVAYSRDERSVRLLQGQALFEVAKNRNRPFVVLAGDRRVTAVGTAFDVRVDDGGVRVVLAEGRVTVDPLRHKGMAKLVPGLDRQELQPGEQLIADPYRPLVIAAADVERLTSWDRGRLIFRDDLLSEAIKEMNRYSRTQILIEDPRIGDLRISGVFNVSRPENFLAAVTAFYPLEERPRSKGAVVLDWRKAG